MVVVLRPGGRTTIARAPAPLPVVAATATTGDIAITYTALGTVTPLASVTVQSQISGYLASVAFQEGQEVKAGDVLAQIDPRPYQAALDQAEGQLARDQAQLDGARVDLQRYATLMKQDSIAKQTYDDQSRHRPPARRHGAARSGRGRHRARQPGLLPDHRAGYGQARLAPSRSRQLRHPVSKPTASC